MTDLEKELLTKVQALHDVIERHPYLSGMVTDDFHGHLDFIIKNAHHLDGIDRKEWRKQPDEDAIEPVTECPKGRASWRNEGGNEILEYEIQPIIYHRPTASHIKT